MVAPGNSLEFYEGSAFRDRVTDFPEFRDAVFAYLRSWPNAGREVCGGIKDFGFSFVGRNFTILFRRLGQRLSVLDAFEIPKQEKQPREAIQLFRAFYCGETRRTP